MIGETATTSFHADYVCPACHRPLVSANDSLHCGDCRASYPLDSGIADFSGGRYYDNFVPGQELPAEHLAALADEVPGAVSRIRDFYLPLLEKRVRKPGVPLRSIRVLDCGCGNGMTVDLLREAGFEAWGNDSSALRKWQWRERESRGHLAVAEGSRLPFRDGHFDAVICSGVLEHIGVSELGGERYVVNPLPDRDERRRDFLRELLRVVDADGRVWVDFPNGAFPIDFWHGAISGRGARWHGRREGFLPTVGEVLGYLAAIGPELGVRALGPHRRLRLIRVRRHWYGRLLNLPARLLLRFLSLPPASRLAGSGLNPYLVLEIRRTK